MPQLVQTGYYDELIPYVSRISRRTRKVTFELPARFLFEPEKTASFASEWSEEIVREDRSPTLYGLPQFGAVLKQIITVKIVDADVFEYIYNRLLQNVNKGDGQGHCTSLEIELW